ncbi:MAG: hypothetical protein U0263_38035 [Polyangiaceae bacterium]
MRFAPLALCFAVTSFAWSAAADVPPEPGYVESCTLEKQKQSGDECVSCSASFQDPKACQSQHAGFEQRCRTRGASVWTEIWCKPRATPPSTSSTPEPEPSASDTAASPAASSAAPTAVAPEKSGACGACAVSPASGLSGLLASCVALVAWSLRRASQVRRKRAD